MITVIEHEPGCPLDRLGGWLDGVGVRVVRPYAGEPVPASAPAGLIVLGGRMSAHDDDAARWLPAVRALLATAVERSTPVLGICLGAQLLAVAAGGRVDVAAPSGRESGVADVRWRPDAAADPLVSGLPDPFPGPSMHADAVAELPPGAVWLADSAMYPYQVFRVGQRAWGVQFHPEVSASTFRAWAESHPDVDSAAAVGEFARRDAEVAAAGAALAHRFVALAGAGTHTL